MIQARVTFESFAENFFTEESDYVRHQRLRGREISTAHLRNEQAKLTNYAIPFFGGKMLKNIETEDMERFRDMLIERGLSASTVRQTQIAVRQVFEWATRRRVMQRVPLIETVVGKAKERGVLSPEEVKALFQLPDWPRKHLAINMLAYSTGMRLGEILALRRSSVHQAEGYVDVEVSWDRVTKSVKSTKTRKARFVPVPTSVQSLLLETMDASPYREPEDLIFAGRKRSQPLDRKMVERVLFKMLERLGIDEDKRATRNISFHSSRHFYNSLLINRGIPDLKVKALTGHSTDAMTAHYYHIDDLKDVAALSETIFVS